MGPQLDVDTFFQNVSEFQTDPIADDVPDNLLCAGDYLVKSNPLTICHCSKSFAVFGGTTGCGERTTKRVPY